MAGQDDGKASGDGGLSDKKVDPTDGDQNNELNVTEEYDMLDSKLDELNTALDFLEQKNDDIHEKLKDLLQSSIDIRQQLKGANVDTEANN